MVVLGVACSSTPPPFLFDPSDTGTLPGTVAPVEAAFTANYFGYGDYGYEGAVAASTVDEGTLGYGGATYLEVPASERFVVDWSHPNFLAVRAEGYALPGTFFEHLIPLVEAEEFGSPLDQRFERSGWIDDGLGHIAVQVRAGRASGGTPGDLLVGASVSIDADAEVVAREKSGWAYGTAPGSTVADGDVIFANVDLGTVTVTVELPPGRQDTCGLSPGGSAVPGFSHAVESVPNTVTSLVFVCW